MDQAAVVKILRRRIERSNQVSVAGELGVSPAYLSDVLLGRRAPGPTILLALGLQQKIIYVKANDSV